LTPNAEGLAAYMPDRSVRAAYFDAGLSWFNPLGEAAAADKVAQLELKGATTRLVASDPTPTDYSNFLYPTRPGYVVPKTWVLIDARCGGQPTQPPSQTRALPPGSSTGICKIVFDDAPSTPILRQEAIGELEQWDEGTGWKPYDYTGINPIKTKPQTAVSADTPAGATRLPIFDQNDLGVDPQTNDWFHVGDTVVLDPGGPHQESVKVTGFGSLLLDRPLQFEHLAGELVSVVATASAPTTTTPSNVTPTSTPTGTPSGSATGAPAASDPSGTSGAVPTTTAGTLPQTGLPTVPLVGMGALLFLLGSVLAESARRRRRLQSA